MSPRGARKSNPTEYLVFRVLLGTSRLTLELVGSTKAYGAIQAGNTFKDPSDQEANGYVAVPLSNFTLLGGEVVRPEPEFKLSVLDAATLLTAPPVVAAPEEPDTEPIDDRDESEQLQVA